MWKDSNRNIVVIFQPNILRIVGFYVRHSASVLNSLDQSCCCIRERHLLEIKYHKYSPPSIRSYFSFKTLIQLLHYAGSSELVFFVEFKEYQGKKLLLFPKSLHFCGIFACLSLKCTVNCIVWWYICTDTVNAY